MNKEVTAYNNQQKAHFKAVCDMLCEVIWQYLPNAKGKIWHGSPVWFLEDNPTVGYAVRKHGGVQLLFWSGQSFDEPDLKPEGSFKAAQAFYMSKDEINLEDLQRWLKKSEEIQWDYKNIVKRRGVLERLT